MSAEVAPRRAPSLALGGTYFSVYGALGAFLPYFPLWLESHGFRSGQMAAILALVPAMAAVVPPCVGRLCDRRGARANLLIFLAVLSAASMAGLGGCERLGVEIGLPLLLVGFVPFAAARPALIQLADRIALETGEDYGKRRLWGSVGFLVVELLVGRFWSARRGFPLPWWIGGWLLLGAALALALPRRTAASPQARAAERVARPAAVYAALSRLGEGLRKNRRLAPFLLSACLFQAANISYHVCGSLLFRDLGAGGTAVGVLWGIGVVAEVALMTVAGGWTRRIRPEVLLVLAQLAGVLRWALTASLRSPLPAYFVQLLHGATFGLTLVCCLEYIKRSAPPQQLGQIQGALMAAQALGGIAGSLAWPVVYATSGAPLVFGWAAALSLVSAALTQWGLVAPRRAPLGSAAPP